MARESWMKRLQARWGLSSLKEVTVVLLVFTCTGFTILFIKPFVLHGIFGSETLSGWYSVAYYILILPFYNIVLLIYGFLFGKFQFFWKFEQRFFKRILSIRSNNKH